MSTTTQVAFSARLLVGAARAEITPPVGIYHPMWGAARHHRATGVHRPLMGDVLALAPLEGGAPSVRVQLDMVGLDWTQYETLATAVAEAAQVERDRVVLAFSHTHSGGLFNPNRFEFPGGELIPAYLQAVKEKMQTAVRAAIADLQPGAISYATGRCDMAANRDYWDADNGIYACGFNPDAAADDTLLVARITDAAGAPIALLVNYACHPTTLAWENTLLSPDYVGAMRAVVEGATGATCIFTLGACGDLGPRRSHVGDTAVADANGRQLGYAVLSALEAMGAPAADFVYQGPVVSGATLGTWAYLPLDPKRLAATARFDGGAHQVDLPMKPRPDRAQLDAELAEWLERQAEADARGDAVAARDAGARAERARRWLARLEHLPSGATYPFPYAVYRFGDGFWVSVGGEPYSRLQTELRGRFPQAPILFSVLAGAMQVAYLLPRARYGQGLYQEEPSILAPGCLEILIEAVAQRIADLSG